MQVVYFTDEKLGNVEWELPIDLANHISDLPKEEQDTEPIRFKTPPVLDVYVYDAIVKKDSMDNT